MSTMLDRVMSKLNSIDKAMDKIEAEDATARENLRRRQIAEREESQKRADSACRQAQSRCDEVLSLFNRAAPRALPGEDEFSYRSRIASELQQRLPNSSELKRVDFAALPKNAAFTNLEAQLFDEVSRFAVSNDAVPDGEMVMRRVVDPVSGHKENQFFSRQSFVRDFTLPAKHVRMLTPSQIVERSRSLWV
ncbi:hypothetical protein [Rhodoblastus sp.]|uniref:hypothetical protein n=1 Tax=Rhodoblastus sp. TaxID=1962975 RepID=UPI0025ED3A04|nr:hypothetical protein [Rhodoblastus sp.]